MSRKLNIEVMPSLRDTNFPMVLILAYDDYASTYRRIMVSEFLELDPTNPANISKFMLDNCDELDGAEEECVEIIGVEDTMQAIENLQNNNLIATITFKVDGELTDNIKYHIIDMLRDGIQTMSANGYLTPADNEDTELTLISIKTNIQIDLTG